MSTEQRQRGAGPSTDPAENCSAARRRMLVLVLLVAATATPLLLRPRPRIQIPTDQLVAVERYAGNESCTGCHQHKSEQFAQTAHARALSRADSEAAVSFVVGQTAATRPSDAAGRPQVGYVWKDGKLRATVGDSDQDQAVPVEWCFGSGRPGMTFATLLRDRQGRSRMLEHHWSWFGNENVLAITPGHTVDQNARGLGQFGQVVNPEMTRQCFACHATAFRYAGGRIDAGSVIAGIQCERCHGPRAEHVQVELRSHSPRLAKVVPPVPAREQVYACGECHRTPGEINDEIRPDNPVIARFPSVGLVQSKCFLKTESLATLTCTTCHDPHGAERPEIKFYDNRCQACHDPNRDRANVPCSIDPEGRSCVGCHMPKVPLHEHLSFTDHWIRVQRTSPKLQVFDHPPGPSTLVLGLESN